MRLCRACRHTRFEVARFDQPPRRVVRGLIEGPGGCAEFFGRESGVESRVRLCELGNVDAGLHMHAHGQAVVDPIGQGELLGKLLPGLRRSR